MISKESQRLLKKLLNFSALFICTPWENGKSTQNIFLIQRKSLTPFYICVGAYLLYIVHSIIKFPVALQEGNSPLGFLRLLIHIIGLLQGIMLSVCGCAELIFSNDKIRNQFNSAFRYHHQFAGAFLILLNLKQNMMAKL